MRLGIIGCGNMGSAIIEALITNKCISSKRVIAYDCDKKKTASLAKRSSVRPAESIEKLACASDVIILGVKPQNIEEVAAKLKGMLKKKTIVSILAGTSITRLKKLLGAQAKIIRAMPNLGITVECGITALCKSKNATRKDLMTAKNIFSACGAVLEVKEKLFDVVTALSGSGPAYYFYITELLTAFGEKHNLSRKDAQMLTQVTACGASLLMASSKDSPKELRAKVTSKGGTTAAALSVLKSKQFKTLFDRALKKAVKRARELNK